MFTTPPACWPLPKPVSPPPQPRPPVKRQAEPLDWADHAERQEWREAIMAYLRENWGGRHKFWAVVNAIAAEAQPETRWQVREYTQQVLEALMQLVRERKVSRYRRRWIAGLDVPIVIETLVEASSGQRRKT